MKNRITVFYTNPGYPVRRTILGKCENVRYVRLRSFASLAFRLLGCCGLGRAQRACGSVYAGGIPWGGAGGGAGLCHFFNDIPLPWLRRPFVTTFETSLPRIPSRRLYGMALESLASPRCRRLLALSECARRRQIREFAENGLEGLAGKIAVLHPPQGLPEGAGERVRKPSRPRGEVTFIFVGRDLAHKGGYEAVKSLVSVRKEFPVRLTLIGDAGRRDYMWAPWDDPVEIGRLLERHSDWIDYHPSLPNDLVLEKIRQADVGLLPTRGDTYGYSVLEMQAAGLPCITTDLRALPEINGPSAGWIIRVPKNSREDADFDTVEKKRVFCDTVERGLRRICLGIAADPGGIEEKGAAARRRIAEFHDPGAYAARLMEIYGEALRG